METFIVIFMTLATLWSMFFSLIMYLDIQNHKKVNKCSFFKSFKKALFMNAVWKLYFVGVCICAVISILMYCVYGIFMFYHNIFV